MITLIYVFQKCFAVNQAYIYITLSIFKEGFPWTANMMSSH